MSEAFPTDPRQTQSMQAAASKLWKQKLEPDETVMFEDLLSGGTLTTIVPADGKTARTVTLDEPLRERLEQRLREAGLKATTQRIHLAALLFACGDRHATAEMLHEESRTQSFRLSLATVYNTLNQFKAAGLVREIATYGGKSWYDTNTGPHFHFYHEEQQSLFDIPEDALKEVSCPELPEDMELVGIDMVVRVRKAKRAE